MPRKACRSFKNGSQNSSWGLVWVDSTSLRVYSTGYRTRHWQIKAWLAETYTGTPFSSIKREEGCLHYSRIHLRVQTPIGKMKTWNEWRCKNKRRKINIPLSLCIHSHVNGTCVNVGEDTEGRGGYHTCSEMNGVSVFLGKLLAPEHTLDGQMLAGTP